MFPSGSTRIERLTDKAIAAEWAAGRFLAGPELRDLQLDIEAAAHLAYLAGEDLQTVYVIGCAREGDCRNSYRVNAREERTHVRCAERVSLFITDGITREQALVRLNHIRAYLVELPRGTVLTSDGEDLAPSPDTVARLEHARDIALQEIDERRDLLF
jgi:hypothetical protein